ncbi:MAG TPA: PhnD/SsuA/transferrin family substrate-binding protein [Terracidiphilus sp.]|nr:PhnD/SsuA/transferrin family substrate-binding protein [Terracidiphilus sp.]
MQEGSITRRQFMRSVTAAAALAAASAARRMRAESRPFRVALSVETLAGANVNDARAAYRVWADEVARGLNMYHSEIIPEIFIPSAQMIQMIRGREVDCFALTAWEYSKVMDEIDPAQMMVENYAVDGMEYVLLVHASSPYKGIADLHGSKILLHHHRDTILLEAWLSILLLNANLSPADSFFEAIDKKDNMNEVILPLFFRRVPAIAITRRSYDTATELNPQLGKDLRVLAVSTPVVSDGFFFRLGCDPQGKNQFQDALLRFTKLPAGRQCLALYQSTGFFARPCSIMSGSLAMIHQYERLQKAPHRKA